MFVCQVDDCFQSFRDEASLENHKKFHENSSQIDSRRFVCHRCNRTLATKQSLKEHGFTHTGKKPFRCSELGCGKLFRQSSQLCNHRKIHQEAKKMVKNQIESESETRFFAKKLTCAFGDTTSQIALNSKQKITLPTIKF